MGWAIGMAGTVGMAGTLAAAAVGPGQALEGVRPAVRIVSPADGSYVSGPLRLEAVVEPLATVRSVTTLAFFADGQLVCRVSRPPFACDWDAGDFVVEHQVRAVATLAGGGRLTATVRTRKLDHAESVDVDVVQVTATVTDSRGRFVGGLPASAFRVYEDGRPQAITSFVSVDPPLELVAAIDISGSMRPWMDDVKGAVKAFLAAVPDRHEVTLLAFNDTIVPLVRRARDSAARARAVDRLAAWGATALYDVILDALDQLDRVTGRKALVVFSDGEDQGSVATREDVVRRLERSDATLYTIGLGRGATEPGLKQLMDRLARQSGGRAFLPARVDELGRVFREIIEDLSNQYLLSYAPTNTARDGTWRTIRVEVDGYHVRAREGYRAKSRRERR